MLIPDDLSLMAAAPMSLSDTFGFPSRPLDDLGSTNWTVPLGQRVKSDLPCFVRVHDVSAFGGVLL
jgi:hypothetical protein